MKVVIVHGIADDQSDNSYNMYWMPWVERELKNKGIAVVRPVMPDAWDPDYNFWKEEFEQIRIEEDDILIGHSAGGAFLVRWLGETGQKAKKLILVAPWKVQSLEFSEGENEMYDFKINRRVAKNVDKILIFTSDETEDDGKKSVKIYVDFLNADLIELEGCGHFDSEMRTEKFPELLEKILG
jgi:predicted alpha/beta hydrolase family esterase